MNSTVQGEIIYNAITSGTYLSKTITWIEIKEPIDKNYQIIIEASVDKALAIAIVLAIELDDCPLIIDDLQGKNIAHQVFIPNSAIFNLLILPILCDKNSAILIFKSLVTNSDTHANYI